MHDSVVASWQRQDHTWLRFHRVPTRVCPLPAWVNTVFPGQQGPVVAAHCGGESGYLVLQWPDGYGLEQLAPQLSALSARSRRALICTSAQPAVGAGEIHLRYFAPQYGVYEDAATGSAVRVLADYWSSRFSSLTVRQCSPEGGRLLSRVAADHVEVGGRCVTLEVSASHA
jgi:predicted PhzF superfamily epimerase YddE/YHI9